MALQVCITVCTLFESLKVFEEGKHEFDLQEQLACSLSGRRRGPTCLSRLLASSALRYPVSLRVSKIFCSYKAEDYKEMSSILADQ
jgi:hypothetical protein